MRIFGKSGCHKICLSLNLRILRQKHWTMSLCNLTTNVFIRNLCFLTFSQNNKWQTVRGECSVNTDYVKFPIFPDAVDNFPDFSPISFLYFLILCEISLWQWPHLTYINSLAEKIILNPTYSSNVYITHNVLLASCVDWVNKTITNFWNSVCHRNNERKIAMSAF